MEMKRENGHFGRLQRQLQMLECAQSIEQDSFNSAHNVSNVIESFPHHPPPEEDSSAFFKKRKPPQLNLRLQDEDYPRPNNKTALETLYKTSKSIEQFSNFASLSPSRAFPSTLPLPSTLPNNPSHFAPEDSGNNYCRVVLPSGEVY